MTNIEAKNKGKAPWVLRSVIGALPSRIPPILVGSIGRSGSTLLCTAMRAGLAEKRFGRLARKLPALVKDEAWRLDTTELRNGIVYKTHDRGEFLPARQDLRSVYVYGSASDLILSVFACQKRLGDDWIAAHFDHLRVACELSELPTQDGLRIREHIAGWMETRATPCFVVKYEHIWEMRQQLEDFIGFRVHLPERRARKPYSDLPIELRDQVYETYGELDAWIEGLPALVRNY